MGTFEEQAKAVTRVDAEESKRKEAEEARAKFEHGEQLAGILTRKLPREGIADKAFAAANRLVTDVLLGNVPMRNGADAAATIRALMEVGRLEKGEATGYIEHATPEERRSAIMRLQDELGERRREAERAKPPEPAAG